MERVVAGEDTLVIMPTGGGKSMCYQIPALLRPGTGIVVSPLIALMQDQVDGLKQLGVQAAFLNSSLSYDDQREVEQQLLKGNLDLLYVAPERLMTGGFIDLLARIDPALFAIDEVHCISQWGHDFRPEYLQLSSLRERFPHVPCIAVTATADEPTRLEILNRLNIPDDGLIMTGFDRPNIRYSIAPKNNAKRQVLSFIQREHRDEAGIVYCLSRKNVEDMAAWLCEMGLDALPYHAGLPAEERQRNQHRFIHEEGLIVVATIAFGMGIDKPNVRFVVHMNMPKSLEAYYQETGRAGRDGLPADAWMTYSLSDVVLLRKMLESSEADEKQKRVEQHKLNQLFGYSETVECRRRVLLKYFGQSDTAECGNCDNCINPPERWEGTVAAQKVMSCVARTGQRFGVGHLIQVLLGSDSEKVRKFGHDRLPTYGVGKELGTAEWQAVIRQLVAANYLKVDVTGFGGINLTEACGPVLKGKEKVFFRKDPKPVKTKRPKARVTIASAMERPDDQDLFESLRQLRLDIAREAGVPPYIVFGDTTLQAMVHERPRTHGEFKQLTGVGQIKLERYGDAFLEAIRQHEAGY